MKRFLAFAYPDYYPAGGQGDFIGDFDTLEAAVAGCLEDAGNMRNSYGADVLDIQSGQWFDGFSGKPQADQRQS